MSSNFQRIEQQMIEKKAELDDMLAQFQEKMKAEFTGLTRAFFEETGIQAIVWAQYTPYFNDGDECVFRIGEVTFVRENFDPEELDNPYNYEDDTYNPVLTGYYGRRGNDPLTAVCEKFEALMRSNQGLLKDIFGDHTAVYLTADATYDREYDHE